MEQKIYSYGFYLLLGALIGGATLHFSTSKQISNPKIQIEVKNDSIIRKDTIALKPVLNEKNLKAELAKLDVPHQNIVLAQAKLETGNFKSSVCKSHNNLFGLRKGNRYRRYDHWTNCVKDYKRLISSRYNDGSYYKFLKDIGYAEDPSYIEKLKQLV